MSDEFFIFQFPADDEGYATVDQVEGFDNHANRFGTSLAHDPPTQLTMSMYADEPEKTALADHVQSQDRLLVVSRRLKAFLEAQQVSHVEYYPLEIKDHDGKVASTDHVVVHLIDRVECIDVEASGVTWANKDTERQRIQFIKQIVIDPTRVPADRQLFFPRYYDKYPIVRRALAEMIKKEAFTNVHLVPTK